ncbi:hypothetical protein HMPREF9389_1844 [Streptococcus sanguinis SK355]|uniref:Uncharacterized protein n=1 Tax=Streptococcus sanguinis SK355 TaxID=888816 RepID=F3USN6_STRSA|nr:hypothetical protein HMPREF9389_1844 [Streptococcus sanguinis SK355]
MHHILFHLTKDTKAVKSKVKIGKMTEGLLLRENFILLTQLLSRLQF